MKRKENRELALKSGFSFKHIIKDSPLLPGRAVSTGACGVLNYNCH